MFQCLSIHGTITILFYSKWYFYCYIIMHYCAMENKELEIELVICASASCLVSNFIK